MLNSNVIDEHSLNGVHPSRYTNKYVRENYPVTFSTRACPSIVSSFRHVHSKKETKTNVLARPPCTTQAQQLRAIDSVQLQSGRRVCNDEKRTIFPVERGRHVRHGIKDLPKRPRSPVFSRMHIW